MLYVAYFISFQIHEWLKYSLSDECSNFFFIISVVGMFLAWPITILVILFQEVLLKDNNYDDGSMTDKSERTALVVYGMQSVISGGVSVLAHATTF